MPAMGAFGMLRVGFPGRIGCESAGIAPNGFAFIANRYELCALGAACDSDQALLAKGTG